MLVAVMNSSEALGGIGKLLLVLFVLIAILALMLRVLRPLLKWIVIGGALFLIGGWWFLGWGGTAPTEPDPPAPASAHGNVEVAASAQGGWDVTVPAVDGASGYAISLDGDRVGSADSAGRVHVQPAAVAAKAYAPGPVHSLEVLATVPGSDDVRLTERFCSPVVILAARGTNENPGKVQFGNGIGSRNWRTWMYLAEQTGVKPADSGVVPTVIGAAPVHYRATAADYSSSRDEGKADLLKRWKSVTKECPDSRIVLMGYSQGSDVILSEWQNQPTGSGRVVGVVSFADPHFDNGWVDQGIVWPRDAVFKHDGMLGGRGLFGAETTAPIQAWCLPKDPVCQKLPRPWGWHGDEYDVYEKWAAFNLAPSVGDVLGSRGFTVPEPVQPTETPSTQVR